MVLYHLIPWAVFLWCVLYLVVCESDTVVKCPHLTPVSLGKAETRYMAVTDSRYPV
jgi:hypothetical protein